MVTHVEVRGPAYKGSLRGGSKTLFRFAWSASELGRLAVLEAPIDALSLAALERARTDTLYVAMVIGTDANTAGDRFAERLQQIAQQHGLRHERLRPPEGEDRNDVLRREERGVR